MQLSYRNTLRDDAALLNGIPLSNAALCHVEDYRKLYTIFAHKTRKKFVTPV